MNKMKFIKQELGVLGHTDLVEALNNLSSNKSLDDLPKTINGNLYCGGNKYIHDEEYVRNISDIRGNFICDN